MQFFGDRNKFGIAYRPVLNLSSEQTHIHCNLVLKGIAIGNPDDWNLLGTCASSLYRLQEQVRQYEGRFYDPMFSGLSDREIIELIYKSNQLEAEYDSKHAYLPALPTNDLWKQYTITLADTTDQYALVVVEENEALKFLWQSWEKLEQGENSVHTVMVDYQTFYSALEACLDFLKSTYPNQLEWLDPKQRTTPASRNGS